MVGSWSLGSLMRLLGVAMFLCVGWILLSSGQAHAAERPAPMDAQSDRPVTALVTDVLDAPPSSRTPLGRTSPGVALATDALSERAARANRTVAAVVETALRTTARAVPAARPATSGLDAAVGEASSTVHRLAGTVRTTGDVVDHVAGRAARAVTAVVEPVVDSLPGDAGGQRPTVPVLPAIVGDQPADLAAAAETDPQPARGAGRPIPLWDRDTLSTSFAGAQAATRSQPRIDVVDVRDGSGPPAPDSQPPACPVPAPPGPQTGGAAHGVIPSHQWSPAGARTRFPPTSDRAPAGQHPLPGSRPD